MEYDVLSLNFYFIHYIEEISFIIAVISGVCNTPLCTPLVLLKKEIFTISSWLTLSGPRFFRYHNTPPYTPPPSILLTMLPLNFFEKQNNRIRIPQPRWDLVCSGEIIQIYPTISGVVLTAILTAFF